MVRGSKDEDSLDVVGPGHVLVSPSGSGSTEVQAGMGGDECFDKLWFFILLGVIDVLGHLGIEVGS